MSGAGVSGCRPIRLYNGFNNHPQTPQGSTELQELLVPGRVLTEHGSARKRLNHLNYEIP